MSDAFEQSVRIALADRPVHEGTRVALVSVADQVLVLAAGGAGQLPLAAGREATAAATAQAAALDDVADLVRRVLVHGGVGRRVAAAGDVLVEVVRIDDAAAGQDPAQLGLEEGVIGQARHRRPGRQSLHFVLAQQAFARNPTLQDDGVQEGGGAVGHDGPEAHARAARELDVHDGLFRAEADTAHTDQVRRAALTGQPGLDGGNGLLGARAEAAGAGTDEDGGPLETLPAQARDELGRGLPVLAGAREGTGLERGKQFRGGQGRRQPAAGRGGRLCAGVRLRHGSPPHRHALRSGTRRGSAPPCAASPSRRTRR